MILGYARVSTDGQSVTVQVGFQPNLTSAIFGDSITIMSNDPNNPTLTVNLTGKVFDKQSPSLGNSGRFGQFYYRDCDALSKGECLTDPDAIDMDPD